MSASVKRWAKFLKLCREPHPVVVPSVFLACWTLVVIFRTFATEEGGANKYNDYKKF